MEKVIKMGEKDRQRKGMPILLGVMFFMVAAFLAVPDMAYGEIAYGFILQDSSWEYLAYEQITDMPLQVVCYAKNEIYARNGRRFVSSELQNYFDEQYWYCGVYEPDAFSDAMLNVYETANVALLSQREKELGGYALDTGYYDYDAVYQYIADCYYYDYGYDDYYVDPDSYILYDSDRRYISASEISWLSLQELNYARNEIYARRGYIFQSQELRDYFGSKYWYYGTLTSSQFSSAVFNDYEKANIELLKRYEYTIAPNGYQLY